MVDGTVRYVEPLSWLLVSADYILVPFLVYSVTSILQEGKSRTFLKGNNNSTDDSQQYPGNNLGGKYLNFAVH